MFLKHAGHISWNSDHFSQFKNSISYQLCLVGDNYSYFSFVVAKNLLKQSKFVDEAHLTVAASESQSKLEPSCRSLVYGDWGINDHEQDQITMLLHNKT